MFEKVLKSRLLHRAAERIAPGKAVQLSGLWGSAGPLAAAALGAIADRPVLFVAGGPDEADDIADDITVLTGKEALIFPAWEAYPAGECAEVTAERMRLCSLLAKPQAAPEVIVAPIMAMLQPVPSRQALAEAGLSLHRGEALEPEQLVRWLIDEDFERVEQVDQVGQFARRGGIVDVLPAGADQAVRLEFAGDRLESLRLFDLDSQRSTGDIDAYDLTSLSAGRRVSADRATHLLEYLPRETIICTAEPDELRELADELHRRSSDLADQAGSPPLREPQEMFTAMAEFARVEMFRFSPGGAERRIDLGVRSLQRISANTHEALTELAELSAACEVWVYCETPAERRRFGELLAGSHPKLAKCVRTAIGHVRSGFHWPDEKLVLVGHHEIFHRYSKLRRIRRVRAGRPIESLLDLSAGDYVVHVAHGVARFEGLRKLERDGVSEEYLSLRFADNALLHVPASRINLVQKYIGARRQRPSLSKLGGISWGRKKQRVVGAVRDLAAEMLRIQAARRAMGGESYPLQTDWQRQFAGEFVYTETEDQFSAMQQIDADMARRRPMDRLLCGDVGYGKTELAMRAAFRVAEAGKQVAVLVPTTVLADQHYRTFTERMADYPFAIDSISRFRTASQQADILKRLALGQIDILIGTHRLLSGDVRFADLGLVVIDEEQRFGVAHKERLKAMRTTVDVLTMTATPIPRTLHMALLGLRDICSLATPPLDRRAIHTEVARADDDLIRLAIARELNRGGQVFFVHNRVLNIQSVAEHVQSLAGDARVDVAHGQMPEGRLEETMLRFVRQETDVLVCTTIIESGLDIPTANTMIIHDADRFGLAQLHQLRGRVGRYKHRAYCYLLLPASRPVTLAAAKRLKAVEEFSDLGAGFQIAMRDLEIRGAGNILGPEQSGHIAAVGYELYCQMLADAVCELRGQPRPVRRDVHVELGIEAYIPRSYIPAQRQRMEIYRRMALCADGETLARLEADLADAYGLVPPGAETLLRLTEVRIRAAAVGIESIIRMDPDIVFAFCAPADAKGLFDGAAGTVRWPDEKTAHWRLPPDHRQMPTLVNVLLSRLRQAHARI
ncbi:MAG: transcription-repair coupling factor [Planctomycetota bacterium]|nr:transcription-repair coupling factor [Planctomycetota bacterium]